MRSAALVRPDAVLPYDLGDRMIALGLNRRPRKTFGFETPATDRRA